MITVPKRYRRADDILWHHRALRVASRGNKWKTYCKVRDVWRWCWHEFYTNDDEDDTRSHKFVRHCHTLASWLTDMAAHSDTGRHLQQSRDTADQSRYRRLHCTDCNLHNDTQTLNCEVHRSMYRVDQNEPFFTAITTNISSGYKFATAYKCQKLWKLVESRGSYCNEKSCSFMAHPVVLYPWLTLKKLVQETCTSDMLSRASFSCTICRPTNFLHKKLHNFLSLSLASVNGTSRL